MSAERTRRPFEGRWIILPVVMLLVFAGSALNGDRGPLDRLFQAAGAVVLAVVVAHELKDRRADRRAQESAHSSDEVGRAP